LEPFDGHGAVERCRQGGRVLDPLAIAAGGGADLFERRQFVEVNQRRLVAARRFALRVVPNMARRTAPHIELFMTTKSIGSLCTAEA